MRKKVWNTPSNILGYSEEFGRAFLVFDSGLNGSYRTSKKIMIVSANKNIVQVLFGPKLLKNINAENVKLIWHSTVKDALFNLYDRHLEWKWDSQFVEERKQCQDIDDKVSAIAVVEMADMEIKSVKYEFLMYFSSKNVRDEFEKRFCKIKGCKVPALDFDSLDLSMPDSSF